MKIRDRNAVFQATEKTKTKKLQRRKFITLHIKTYFIVKQFWVDV